MWNDGAGMIRQAEPIFSSWGAGQVHVGKTQENFEESVWYLKKNGERRQKNIEAATQFLTMNGILQE